jgi:predicted GNAT family N-acyltransferase
LAPETTSNPTVRLARGADELRAAIALRHAVFVDEQRVPISDEVDGRDDEALQVVAVRDDRVIGTCRALVEGRHAKLGRMAVERDARRGGIGSLLLAEAERAAREHGATLVSLAAQVDAQPFYAAHGYRAVGPTFDDAGIDHVRMEKPLA